MGSSYTFVDKKSSSFVKFCRYCFLWLKAAIPASRLLLVVKRLSQTFKS